MTSKSEVREEILNRINRLDQEERKKESRQLCTRMMKHPLWKNAATILGFMAFRHEIDLSDLWSDALEQGKSLYLPRMGQQGMMDFLLCHDLRDLQPNRLGIKEPSPGSLKWQGQGKRPVLMILPGLLFDIQGNRIGWGGGYYDRWLQKTRRTASFPDRLAGAAYNLQLTDHLGLEPDSWDIPLDAVARPRGISLCN